MLRAISVQEGVVMRDDPCADQCSQPRLEMSLCHKGDLRQPPGI
jgi:hypothetical protein